MGALREGEVADVRGAATCPKHFVCVLRYNFIVLPRVTLNSWAKVVLLSLEQLRNVCVSLSQSLSLSLSLSLSVSPSQASSL